MDNFKGKEPGDIRQTDEVGCDFCQTFLRFTEYTESN